MLLLHVEGAVVEAVGTTDGDFVGQCVGLVEGNSLDGAAVGGALVVGRNVGADVGVADGQTVGPAVGTVDGPLLLDGSAVGMVLGTKKELAEK